MQKWIYLGVDQTGAVNKSGVPKPLASCYIRQNKLFFAYLPSFSKESIIEVLRPKKGERIAVCADCVIGLPDELQLTWREALRIIRSSQGYGREAAKNFFDQLGNGKILTRRIEVECKANSVFREKPFQKNIQTGTYRIWKDIAFCDSEFCVPFLGEASCTSKIPLYEGYPSLSWKLIFGTKTRQPQDLSNLIHAKFPNLEYREAHQLQVNLDHNLADALVLAMSLRLWMKATLPTKILSREGWILGQPPGKNLY